jgi:hypothetical protein
MTTTIEPAGPDTRISAPTIREVCLVGSRARRYRHLTQRPHDALAEDSELRTQDAGLREIQHDRD